MKNALAVVGTQRIRPKRDAKSSLSGTGRRPARSGDDYWRIYNRIIGGTDVRFSPPVAAIVGRLERAESGR